MLVCCLISSNVTGRVGLALPFMRCKAFWENLSVLLSLISPFIRPPHDSLPPVQSETAQSFSYSDSLSWLQVEAEVFGSFEQQNDGGAEVKLSESCPFLQGYTCWTSRGHALITFAVRKLVLCANIAAVEESAFGVAWSVGLELLDEIKAQ